MKTLIISVIIGFVFGVISSLSTLAIGLAAWGGLVAGMILGGLIKNRF